MDQDVLRQKLRPWPWTQFGIALGLLLVGFPPWLVATESMEDRPDPIGLVCLRAASFIAITRALGGFVLLVRRFLI